MNDRLVVGISGATGICYGVRVLELARKAGVETHLVVTSAGQQTRAYETGLSARDLAALADTMGAAEIVYALRQAGLPVASAWCPFDAAVHWLVLAVEQDWHDKLAINAGELAKRVADVLFSGKPGFNAPKTLLVEDDIDITDLGEVIWAFATRAHPEHGEFHFPGLESDQLAVYLDEEEAHSFRAGKVIHNCLLADRFPGGQRPVKGNLENGWPDDIRRRVLDNWNAYGFSAETGSVS